MMIFTLASVLELVKCGTNSKQINEFLDRTLVSVDLPLYRDNFRIYSNSTGTGFITQIFG